MKRKVLISSIILFALMILLVPIVQAKEVCINVETQNSVYLEVESSDTIEALKNKIQDATDVPAEHQILSYNGKVFEEGRTVADYIIDFINEENIIIDMSLKSYQITFDPNGGIGNMEPQLLQYRIPGEILKNLFIRDGHIFDTWNTVSDGSGTVYYDRDLIGIESDIKLYAQWIPVTFLEKITVNFADMEKFSSITVNENDAFAFLAFKGLINPLVDNNIYDKDGKLLFEIDVDDNIVFAEGLTEADNISYTLTEEDKIMYGKDFGVVPRQIEIIFVKEIPKYKVVFDANEGTFNDGDTLIIEEWEIGDEDTLEIPTRDEYEFVGFFTEKTGGTKLENYIAEAGIDADLIFYAQWQKKSDGATSVTPPDSGDPTVDANKPVGGMQEGDNISMNLGNPNVSDINSSNVTSNQGETKSPQTGDNVMIYVVGLVISTIGLIYMMLIIKKTKNN